MLIGTMPMDTLAGFGFGLTHRQLDGMVEQWQARAVTPSRKCLRHSAPGTADPAAVGWSAGMSTSEQASDDDDRHPSVPVHGCARPGHRDPLAGLVGCPPHVRDAQPLGAAGRSRAGRRAGREAVRARHVPVPVGQRPARRAPARLHRHRRLRPLQAHDGLQRAAHDGLRRLRSAGRAVRGRDRPAPAHHDRPERRQLPPPTAASGPGARSAPQRLDDRPDVLPLDAVDLQPDLQRLVRHRAGQGAPDQRAGRRVRDRCAGHARRPAVARADA